MIIDFIDNVQRDVLKSLIDELYRLEEENAKLRVRASSGNVTANAGGYDYKNMDRDDALRYIKNEIFGDPIDDER